MNNTLPLKKTPNNKKKQLFLLWVCNLNWVVQDTGKRVFKMAEDRHKPQQNIFPLSQHAPASSFVINEKVQV